MSIFKLNLDNLKKLPLNQFDNDFYFVVNDRVYETNRVIADFISSKIRKLHQADHTIQMYEMKTREKGNFGQILDYVKNQQIKLDSESIPYFLEVFKQLDNSEEYYNISDEMKQDINIDNILRKIQLKVEIPLDITEEINFLSEHFEDAFCNLNEILQLSPFAFEEIFKHPNFQIPNEDNLLQLILVLYSNSSKYSSLFQYVNFSNVSNELITKFYNTFDFNFLNANVWKNICSSLIKPETSNVPEEPICTYHSESLNIEQPLYHCKTCDIFGEHVICESCIKNCHKNHEVIYAGNGTSKCSCGSGELRIECKCLPQNKPARCTFSTSGKDFVFQRVYHCKTCGITIDKNLGLCQNCALTCHKDHNIIYSGIRQLYCDCSFTGTCSCLH